MQINNTILSTSPDNCEWSPFSCSSRFIVAGSIIFMFGTILRQMEEVPAKGFIAIVIIGVSCILIGSFFVYKECRRHKAVFDDGRLQLEGGDSDCDDFEMQKISQTIEKSLCQDPCEEELAVN